MGFAETDEAARSQVARSSFGHRPGGAGGFFRGCPAAVFEQIRRLHAEAGVGVVDLIFNDNRGRGAELPYEEELRSLRLFAAEVLPRLRGL